VPAGRSSPLFIQPRVWSGNGTNVGVGWTSTNDQRRQHEWFRRRRQLLVCGGDTFNEVTWLGFIWTAAAVLSSTARVATGSLPSLVHERGASAVDVNVFVPATKGHPGQRSRSELRRCVKKIRITPSPEILAAVVTRPPTFSIGASKLLRFELRLVGQVRHIPRPHQDSSKAEAQSC